MEENTNVTVAENATNETKTFTQDEVNNLIKERLDRAEKKWQEKYASVSAEDLASKTEELNKQIADLGNSLNDANSKATADAETLAEREKAIADLEARLKQNETDSAKIRIALENGIPYELANRLQGSTEEEIAEDAKKLAPLISQKAHMPLHNPEASQVDGVMARFKELNPNIKI